MATTAELDRRVAELERAGKSGDEERFREIERRLADVGIPLYNSAGALIGIVNDLQADTNVTLSRSGKHGKIASAGGGANHNLLSATHPDTTVAGVTAGALIRGNAAGTAWEQLPIGTASYVLTSVGGVPVWQPNPVTAHEADTTNVHEATSLGTTGMKQTAILTAEAATLATTDGATRAQIETATYKNNYYVCDFADAATKYISYKFVLPDNWDGGALTIVPVWETTATSGSVRWQVDAVVKGDSDAADAAFGTAATSDEAVDATASDVSYGSAISFTPSGTLAGGKECIVRIARLGAHANDTCAATARYHEAKLEYGVNALSA